MENDTSIAPKPALARRWRVLIWAVVLILLGVTFAAYGQVELLIAWVSAQLC